MMRNTLALACATLAVAICMSIGTPLRAGGAEATPCNDSRAAATDKAAFAASLNGDDSDAGTKYAVLGLNLKECAAALPAGARRDHFRLLSLRAYSGAAVASHALAPDVCRNTLASVVRDLNTLLKSPTLLPRDRAEAQTVRDRAQLFRGEGCS
jgi:hypothetical protein